MFAASGDRVNLGPHLMLCFKSVLTKCVNKIVLGSLIKCPCCVNKIVHYKIEIVYKIEIGVDK